MGMGVGGVSEWSFASGSRKLLGLQKHMLGFFIAPRT